MLAARALHYSPIAAGNIVNACCILHNIANMARAPVPADEVYAEVLSLQQVYDFYSTILEYGEGM